MKFLRKFFDKQEKKFSENDRLKRFFPLFEAIESFFYTPGKITNNPVHVRDAMDLKRIMLSVILALAPVVIMALYNTGYQANVIIFENMDNIAFESWRLDLIKSLNIGFNPSSLFANIFHGMLYFLPIYLITLVAGGFWEVLFAIVRKHTVQEGFFVTSLLFPLIMPPDIPLWQVAIGISFGVVVGKEIFGGVGMNIVNPALCGRIFLFFAYPAQISGNSVWIAVDGVSRATPLSVLAEKGINGLSTVTTQLNGTNIESVTVTFKNAFLGLIPGSMGETSTLACLIGAVMLIFAGVASWRIMLSILVGMAGLAGLFNIIGSSANPMFGVDPLWHLVLGGFAFGAVFMATDPVTCPVSRQGKYVYGLLIGTLVVMIRVINPAFPEGMMMAILFANITAPLIDNVYIKKNIKRRLLKNV